MEATMSDIFKRLEKLQPLADELARESDGMNELIEKLEAKLAALGFGIEASILLYETPTTHKYDDGEEISASRRTWLSYEPHFGGGWSLCIQEQVIPDDVRDRGVVFEETPLRRLTEARRDVRIDALDRIHDLVDSLEENAKKKKKKVRKVKDASKD